jgi:hypothetical protein
MAERLFQLGLKNLGQSPAEWWGIRVWESLADSRTSPKPLKHLDAILGRNRKTVALTEYSHTDYLDFVLKSDKNYVCRRLETPSDLHLFGALGETRTPNRLIRSQMLYPLSYERNT